MKSKFSKEGVPSKVLGKNKEKQNVDQKITTTKKKIKRGNDIKQVGQLSQ